MPEEKSIFYASNIQDDLKSLKNLLIYAVKCKASCVLLTNVITPQISDADNSSYQHAIQFIKRGFSAQDDFQDIKQYINTFKSDESDHIYGKSANRIIEIIDESSKKLKDQVDSTLRLLKACEVPVRIIPGQNENVDLLSKLNPEIREFYLNVETCSLDGFKILGIGGLNSINESVPIQFQDNEYYAGGEDAKNYLIGLFKQSVDIFVSFAPIQYKTDTGEENLFRPLVNEYLPGNIILTSQSLKDNFDFLDKTATNSTLLRGGNFSNLGKGPFNIFWKMNYIDKKLNGIQPYQLRGDYAISIESLYKEKEVVVGDLDIPQSVHVEKDINNKSDFYDTGQDLISKDVKTELLDITLE
ncbi:MAG: hypothetical protein COA79_13080 [Planctomycetota bacterium]|nr:MAG: hypothetical protein COA79_13080 [Planctomycetota bacterium]